VKDLKNLLNKKETRESVSNFIKGGVVQAALSWLVKSFSSLSSGPMGWLVNLVLSQLWDRFGDMAVRWAIRKGALFVDKTDGKIKAVKVENARKSDDSSYDDAVDDVFG
jgi:hypothetical protein